MYISIPKKCSQCGSQKNHDAFNDMGNGICTISTICDECGHATITGTLKTTATKHDHYQFAQAVQPAETF